MEIVTHSQSDGAISAVPQRLVESARSYALKSRSPHTIRAYEKDWRRFSQWCRSVGLLDLPAAPSTVALYLTHRADEGRKVSVLERELAAISVVHKIQNHPTPCQDPAVKELFSGIRRDKGTMQRRVIPLLPFDLKTMVRVLPATLAGNRDRAILLLGFAAALRRSEICALRVEDVLFVADGMEIVIRRSKTDQEGRGEKKGVPWGSDSETCPVRALKEWLFESHLNRGIVFRPVDQYGNLSLSHRGMTGKSMALIIKRAAEMAGIDPVKVSGHSLRAGLVTAAARAGKSLHAIMRQTGHKSVNTVQRYVRESTLFADNAASGIGL